MGNVHNTYNRRTSSKNKSHGLEFLIINDMEIVNNKKIINKFGKIRHSAT